MDILWDLHQHRQIGDARERANTANTRAIDALGTARELEERVDRLTMICLAMWTLLKESGKFKDSDLVDLVREVDLTDGQLDGKYRVAMADCAACKRRVAARHRRCIYCGTERGDSGSVQSLL